MSTSSHSNTNTEAFSPATFWSSLCVASRISIAGPISVTFAPFLTYFLATASPSGVSVPVKSTCLPWTLKRGAVSSDQSHEKTQAPTKTMRAIQPLSILWCKGLSVVRSEVHNGLDFASHFTVYKITKVQRGTANVPFIKGKQYKYLHVGTSRLKISLTDSSANCCRLRTNDCNQWSLDVNC